IKITNKTGDCSEKFELFSVTEDGPGQAAGPSAEGGVTLLRVRTAVVAVVQIENGFMGGAAAHVVSIAAFAVVDVIAGGRLGMMDEAFEQGNLLVALAHEDVPKLVRYG